MNAKEYLKIVSSGAGISASARQLANEIAEGVNDEVKINEAQQGVVRRAIVDCAPGYAMNLLDHHEFILKLATYINSCNSKL